MDDDNDDDEEEEEGKKEVRSHFGSSRLGSSSQAAPSAGPQGTRLGVPFRPRCDLLLGPSRRRPRLRVSFVLHPGGLL